MCGETKRSPAAAREGGCCWGAAVPAAGALWRRVPALGYAPFAGQQIFGAIGCTYPPARVARLAYAGQGVAGIVPAVRL